MSPVLANIYLDEVIDQWFHTEFSSFSNVMVRYADDAVFFFKEKEEAQNFMQQLKRRVEQYGLSLNEDKTCIVDFSKGTKPSFNFLGFTFYWGKWYKRRNLMLKVKTSP